MNLENLRGEIDAIDDEITDLFKKRMEMAHAVAQYKAENNLPVLNRARERDVLARVCGRSGEELESYTRVLFNTLFNMSRAYQNRRIGGEGKLAGAIRESLAATPPLFPTKAVVACQGVEGAYSQLACDKLFPLPSILYFTHFDGVFQAVDKGLCRYGILPIENSSYGSVTAVYDLMKNYNFSIARGIKLHIRHALLAKPGAKLADIREIVSHGQGIGQCSAFLKGLPDVKITECENTATAASMVAESDRTDIAAISSQDCAELYGLAVLSDAVQNNENNYTRFICISKGMEIYPGSSKISLMLSVRHEPGSLYSVMSKFSALGLNITKLESRPIPGHDFEFMFYFDINASVHAPEVIDLLSDLERELSEFVFLGSYLEI